MAAAETEVALIGPLALSDLRATEPPLQAIEQLVPKLLRIGGEGVPLAHLKLCLTRVDFPAHEERLASKALNPPLAICSSGTGGLKPLLSGDTSHEGQSLLHCTIVCLSGSRRHLD